jgi:AcrR family transcriptional regulator
VHVSKVQRARLLLGAAAAVDELGYDNATVTHIVAKAGVSRRTFYSLFENREACFSSLLEDTFAHVTEALVGAEVAELDWCERMRQGLWVILCFFDAEPVLARVCVVQSTRGSLYMLERREEILGQLAKIVDEGRGQSSKATKCPPLTAEGLVGAAVSIVYARLLKGARQPLADLLGELMSMIVLPYLGPAAARREYARALPAKPASMVQSAVPGASISGASTLRDIPMRLTYRTARVLEDIAGHPGASNRMVAEHVGIEDQGQISKLLARLERLGLLENMGAGPAKGEPNAWQLTATGQHVTQSIGADARQSRRARRTGA